MVMDGQTFWIVGGRKLPDSNQEVFPDETEAARLNHDGAVKVTFGPRGTEVKWSVFSPCFASLFYVIEWLPTTNMPVVLQFYLSGWFEEVCQTAGEAIDRIEQVISKSELHLTKRAFVEEFDPAGMSLPPVLEKTWHDHAAEPDSSIDCVYDEKSRKFNVERIGVKSTIAKFYGMSPVSYAAKSGNTYDEIVSMAYTDVLRTGKPRYDHVLAAMRFPDNTIYWVPYQRIVIPKEISNLMRVSVVAEISNVAIKLI
jgi:hypothetical protein